VEVLALIVTGALAGWIAGVLVRGAGYGVVINIVVGVIGGILGGTLLNLLGVAQRGWLVDLAMAVLGAALLLMALELVRRGVRRSA
jgi:uncharacterized membrane protein YeaQ/YmgE (transglycosylase-associated protein family)